MWKQWPYSPQPSFPPLPSSPHSPSLRAALRGIKEEIQRGPRPEMTPPLRRSFELGDTGGPSPKSDRQLARFQSRF